MTIGKICFVTSELYELTANGGIGTATTHIAKFLAQNNFQVDILYTVPIKEKTNDDWQKIYKKEHNINLFFTDLISFEKIEPDYAKRAYVTYQFFKNHIEVYDLIIFPEYLSEGYYCYNAKKTGQLFHSTLLGTITHGSIEWCLDGNKKLIDDVNLLIKIELEKACVANSDFIISPSQYMIDWMNQKKWNLPKEIYVLQNIIKPIAQNKKDIQLNPEIILSENTDSQHRLIQNEIDEIVFFGRLEYRKGIILFCDALNRLDLTTIGCNKITFLGKAIDAMPLNRIKQKLSNLPESIQINFLTHFNSNEAREFLKQKKRLIVMPSLVDNSPCVIMETLELSLPFITTSSGGMLELIDSNDHAYCISKTTPNDLAKKIYNYLTLYQNYIPNSAKTVEEICDNYSSCVKKLITKNQPKPYKNFSLDAMPKVTVIITHYNRGNLITQAIQSVKEQTYKNIDIIIVDDGSTDPHSLTVLQKLKENTENLHIIFQENLYLGAARNAGIRAAKNDYIAFLDDDNYWKSDYLESCMKALLTSDADCITTGTHFFHGEHPPVSNEIHGWLFFGSDIKNTGSLRNNFGDGGGVCKKSSIEKYGYFEEVYGIGHEDWHFFANMALKGGKIICLPELLCFYRITPNSMVRSTHFSENFKLNIKAYEENGHVFIAQLAELLTMTNLEFQTIKQQLQQSQEKCHFFWQEIEKIKEKHQKELQTIEALPASKKKANFSIKIMVFNFKTFLKKIALRLIKSSDIQKVHHT